MNINKIPKGRLVGALVVIFLITLNFVIFENKTAIIFSIVLFYSNLICSNLCYFCGMFDAQPEEEPEEQELPYTCDESCDCKLGENGEEYDRAL